MSMQTIKYVCDGLSAGVVISTIAGWLPPIAALASILWLGYQYHHHPATVERRNKKE